MEQDRRTYTRRAADPQTVGLEQIVAAGVGKALDERWRKTLMTAAAVSVAISLLIVLPFTLVQDAATRSTAADNAQYNCSLLTDIAKVMGAGDPQDRQLRRGGFLSTDAYLRSQQLINQKAIMSLRPGALKRLLQDPETLRLSHASQELDKITTRYWSDVLIPRLLADAQVNCTRRLKG